MKRIMLLLFLAFSLDAFSQLTDFLKYSSPAAPFTTEMDHPALTDFAVRAFPNPGNNGFTLICQSPYATSIYIKVVEGNGRVIERRTLIKGSGFIYLGSEYLPGIYYVEVVQGGNRQTVKLVKR